MEAFHKLFEEKLEGWSIPIAHTVHLKESYKSIQVLLETIQFNACKWSICGDLKAVGILIGMQGGRDVAAAPQTPQLGGGQANFGGPS